MIVNANSTTLYSSNVNSSKGLKYEYRTTNKDPDNFKITFMDTQTNKKVQMSFDPESMSRLYGKFKDDMDINNQSIEAKGKCKSYLETMWQNFRYERNFKDANGDNILNPNELIKAKYSVGIAKLVNSDLDKEVQYENLTDIRDFFDSDAAYKRALQNELTYFKDNKNIFTFDSYFVDQINKDTNFDTKVTNKEMIENISKDPVGKMLLAAAGGNKLDMQGSILRAILEGIKKQQIDIVSQITQDGINNPKIQIDEKEPLPDILSKIDNDKINI